MLIDGLLFIALTILFKKYNLILISAIKGEICGVSCFWALIVDDFSDYSWSFFIQQDISLKEKVAGLISDLKNQNFNVKF